MKKNWKRQERKSMVILVDANVILDYLVTREPFFKPAKKVMELCAEEKVQGTVAFHTIPNIFFILRKVCTPARRRELLKEICRMLTVTGAGHARVCHAIEREEFAGFEDCLQDECAKEIQADYIITRNIQDFKHADVPAMEPEEFLGLYQRLEKGL